MISIYFFNVFYFLRIIYAARKVDRSDTTLLREIGQFLAKNNHFNIATTIFMRINDIKSILHMHMNAENWEDVKNKAFKILLLLLGVSSS